MRRVGGTGRLTAVVVMALVVTLAGCTSTVPAGPSVTSTPSPTPRPSQTVRLSTVSFCVGTSPKHSSGSTVMVRFMRGSVALGEPLIEVPMRVSIQIPAGPFTVVVDGVRQLAGSSVPGETVMGSTGLDCPNS